MGADRYDPAILKAELTRDEARRDVVYRDTRGFSTVGIGHNLSIAQSDFVVDALYDCDIRGCEASLDLHWPWWRDMDPVRQRVVMNLMFNLGSAKLATFRNTLTAMEKGLYASAAQGMRNSAWYAQVGDRAQRLVYMMQYGTTDGMPS